MRCLLTARYGSFERTIYIIKVLIEHLAVEPNFVKAFTERSINPQYISKFIRLMRFNDDKLAGCGGANLSRKSDNFATNFEFAYTP